MPERLFKAIGFTATECRHLMPVGVRELNVKFALDLETIQFPRNPCVVDFNHDTGDPIGRAFMSVEGEELILNGALVWASNDDRAAKIAATANGVPFGLSPTLDFDGAEIVELKANETARFNGRDYSGEMMVYRKVRVLGFSICSIPTNAETKLTLLKFDEAPRLTLQERTIQMEDEEKKELENLADNSGDETGVQNDSQAVRDPELQSFIDEFGLEKGVGFFQRSLSLDEAKMEDYAELKRLSKLSADDSGAADEKKDETAELSNDAPLDDTTDEKEPLAQLSKVASEIRKSLSAFNGVVAKLSKIGTNVGAITTPRASNDRQTQRPSYADSVRKAIGR